MVELWTGQIILGPFGLLPKHITRMPRTILAHYIATARGKVRISARRRSSACSGIEPESKLERHEECKDRCQTLLS